MGNCMETWWSRRDEEQETKGAREKANGSGGDVVVGKESTSNGVKVKLVVTKGELEWLVRHMRDDKGQERKLEDLLMEMELAADHRDVDRAWKPTLESIMEVPEVQSLFDATSACVD